MVGTLHVEVARNPASHLKTADVLSLLEKAVGDLKNPVGDFCLRNPRYAHLKDHVDSVKFCSSSTTFKVSRSSGEDAPLKGSSANRVYPRHDNIEYHIFKLNEEGESTEFIDDDDDDGHSPASYHSILPSRAFHELWDSLIFKNNIKTQLIDYIRTTVLYSEKMVSDTLITWNKVILLHGPPGTGKTSLCKALAHKASIRLGHRFNYGQLIEINSHSLFSKWFSESGKLVMKMFERIQELIEDRQSLVFILIDEVESLAKSRISSDLSREPSDCLRAVNALLTQIDRIKRHPNVIILATSNIVGSIDVALVDRADIKLYIGYPPIEIIYEILASSVNELIRVGIIATNGMFLPPSYQDICRDDKVAAFARKLAEIAEASKNLSGRTLRKIPFLTHVRYIKSDLCTLSEFLDWMQLAIRDEKEDIKAVEDKRLYNNSENASPVPDSPKLRKEKTFGIPTDGHTAIEVQEVAEDSDATDAHSNRSAESNRSNVIYEKTDVRINTVQQWCSNASDESASANRRSRKRVFQESSSKLKGSHNNGVEGTESHGSSKQRDETPSMAVMQEAKATDKKAVRTRARSRSSVRDAHSEGITDDGIRLRNTKVIHPPADKNSESENEESNSESDVVQTNSQYKFRKKLFILKSNPKLWEKECNRMKKCYIDLSKSICTPEDILGNKKKVAITNEKEARCSSSDTGISSGSTSMEEISQVDVKEQEEKNEIPSFRLQCVSTTHTAIEAVSKKPITVPVSLVKPASETMIVSESSRSVHKETSPKSFPIRKDFKDVTTASAEEEPSQVDSLSKCSNLNMNKATYPNGIPLPKSFQLPKPMLLKIEPGVVETVSHEPVTVPLPCGPAKRRRGNNKITATPTTEPTENRRTDEIPTTSPSINSFQPFSEFPDGASKKSTTPASRSSRSKQRKNESQSVHDNSLSTTRRKSKTVSPTRVKPSDLNDSTSSRNSRTKPGPLRSKKKAQSVSPDIVLIEKSSRPSSRSRKLPLITDTEFALSNSNPALKKTAGTTPRKRRGKSVATNGNEVKEVPFKGTPRIYNCEFCDFAFCMKRDLKAHNTKMHSGNRKGCKRSRSKKQDVQCKKKQKDSTKHPKVFISFGPAQDLESSKTYSNMCSSFDGVFDNSEEIPAKRSLFSYSSSSDIRMSRTMPSEAFSSPDKHNDTLGHLNVDEAVGERSVGDEESLCGDLIPNDQLEELQNIPPNSYTCTVCGTIFDTETEVANHENSVHFSESTPETPISQATTETSGSSVSSDCEQQTLYCENPFSDKIVNRVDYSPANSYYSSNSYRSRNQNNSAPADFPLGAFPTCSICGECFTQEYELTHHQRTYHQPSLPSTSCAPGGVSSFLDEDVPVPDAETVIEVETTDEFLTFLSAF